MIKDFSSTNNKDHEISADLILLHAPSVYDFRDRDDVLFAYLSNSDSVNVSPIYEIYPLGFTSICQHLSAKGLKAEIVNVAALMLAHPDLNVEKLLGHMSAPVFGIDLHWMAHCHGSIELAKLIKVIHPDSVVIFGGISSTYYAEELIQYDCVDVVVKGYDTLIPVELLVSEVKRGGRDFKNVPNLVYKDSSGKVSKTPFSHRPSENYNDVATDWSKYADARGDLTFSPSIMTLNTAGCAIDCTWCGGSRYAYKRMMNMEKSVVQKNMKHIHDELHSLGDAAKVTSIYANQSYNETKSRTHQFLDIIRECGYKSVHFEQHQLTDINTMRKMAKSTNAYINLSPESHDQTIGKLCGRGNYSMQEMEEWIHKALDVGVSGIMIWFFIGLPQQSKESVMETIQYCEKLLKKFKGKEVNPLLCPMVPFLDPGSRLFEEPDQHGYRIFHKTLADHRNAMVEPVWSRRLNYETKWMTRREMQDVTYDAVDRLVQIKNEVGMFPSVVSNSIRALISRTTNLLNEIEQAILLDSQLPQDLRKEIKKYNNEILSYTTDQIVPMERPIGNRWFDDYTVSNEIINRCCLKRD